MHVWDVLGKRSEKDEFAVVGGVKAPDAEMALLLARETHFRHKEGVAYAVRRRGDGEVHVGLYDDSLIGGLTDRSYRRQEAYAGVGGKLKRIAGEMAARGLVVDLPRPPTGRTRPAEHGDARQEVRATADPDAASAEPPPLPPAH
jgi:hypothetical protein